MKNYLLTLLVLSSSLLSDVTTEVVHSSISSYYESKTYSNSAQKNDGVVYGIGGDVHTKKSAYKFTYEHGHTNTKQPPLPKDLKVDKLFLKYTYKLDDRYTINLNYISVLNDNLAETDNGRAYGAGLGYKVNKKAYINFTQYYTHYDYFDVFQSDLNLEYKFKLKDVKLKVKSITKYINIDTKTPSPFTNFTDDDYLTTGGIIHAHYKSYHLGAGAYYGKRIFSIMSDGFKIQHHAVEIDRTYVLGLGKTISDFIFRAQYIYQRGAELPAHRDNVKIKNLRFIINYKF